MEENKVYKAESKSMTYKGVAAFILALFIFVHSIVTLVRSGSYESFGFIGVLFYLIVIYFCFVALQMAPQKVEFLENELVRITFMLGNSITIKQEQFKFTEMNGSKKGWTGCLRAKGRMVFFSSDTFPELEKYLIEK